MKLIPRLNKLKNDQNQMEIQLKHLISFSRRNYVLHQNGEVLKLNDIFVWNLQDLSNQLTSAGGKLQTNSFEMIEKMSTFINDPDASTVNTDFSRNVSRKKKFCSKLLYFKCKKCSKSFKDKKSLTNHQSVHYKMSYSCSKCNKVLYSHQSFTNHMYVRKTGKNKCQQCQKIFLLKSTLTNHLCVHNSTCDVCQKCTDISQQSQILKACRIMFNDFKYWEGYQTD